MIKVLILSDVHSNSEALLDVLDVEHSADHIIFLGDGIRRVEWVEDAYPHKRLYYVRGNCDYASYAPTEGIAGFGGLLVFYTHGHLYGVKSSLEALADTARARGADIALFGHTHQPYLQHVRGLYLFNPGALMGAYSGGDPSYGVLTISDGKPAFYHKFL